MNHIVYKKKAYKFIVNFFLFYLQYIDVVNIFCYNINKKGEYKNER